MDVFLSAPRAGRSSHRGFSLIELLVGVAIGLVGMAVVFNTLKTWDTHTRSTASGGEADTTGTIAMFNIERDLKQAGMGIGRAPARTLGCTVRGQNGASVLSFPLAPVSITVGASDGPDTIDLLSGNSSYFVDAAAFGTSTDTTKTLTVGDVKHLPGFQAGDLVVAADTAGHCQLVEITNNTPADGLTLTHATGNYDSFYPNPGGASTFNGGTAVNFPGSGSLFDLGPHPQQVTWSIDSGRLFKTDNLRNTKLELAQGVVSIKAEYGIDADGDNQIGGTEWTTTPPATPPAAGVDWTRVRAIRLAILVRSKQFERTADPDQPNQSIGVTSATPTWAGSDTTASHKGHPFKMTNVDGTEDKSSINDADPNNWRFYRYRVYEKEIPLRNMIWGTAP